MAIAPTSAANSHDGVPEAHLDDKDYPLADILVDKCVDDASAIDREAVLGHATNAGAASFELLFKMAVTDLREAQPSAIEMGSLVTQLK